MPAPQKIRDLVKKFEQNFKHYQSQEYREQDLRHEFLNPFFNTLGWDMEDIQNLGPRRDVRYEEQIKSGAPDFGFYIDDKRQFFVEAKNPSVNVCNNTTTALQLRSYGWSAKTARGILTDFEELAIYDCTVRPKAKDNARIARLECIPYTEYIERWDEIVAIFSREAVKSGSLEKLEKKRAKETVDNNFLKDISRWRENLAKNIALRNIKLTEEEMNIAVQGTINRIIFLRISEDRGIEQYGKLEKITEQEKCYHNLLDIFKKADQRYDSSLFTIGFEKGVKIDDIVIKEIISELYFPKSPYKFDAISADILGRVYEQFLGKIIRLTSGHQAKVEEKYEVRKAGGVYYTPVYIVDYIVKNTIGELLKNKSPKQISNLSILDPACGSGSFLIGAYQYLMDWHRDWYAENDARKNEKRGLIYKDAEGQWQLSLEERKRILVAHIYGVDIDRQATEMAKLSLLLKALEAPEQKSLFNERLLPELDKNIKCGNALIGTDFFSGQMLPDTEEMARINPFDWNGKDGFPEIMSRGGFDAVIGNPPYIKEDTNRLAFDGLHDSPYYQGKMDIWTLFACRAIDLLKDDEYLSFIAPSSWLGSAGASLFRLKILNSGEIVKFVDFNDFKVFKDASIQTMIFVFQKRKPRKSYKLKYAKITDKNTSSDEVAKLLSSDFDHKIKNSTIYSATLKPTEIGDKLISFLDESIAQTLDKILNSGNFKLLKNDIGNGIDVLQDFITNKHLTRLKNEIIKKGDGVFVLKDSEISTIKPNPKELKYLKPYYSTSQINRYLSNNKSEYKIIYADKYFRKHIGEFPNLKQHLDRFKKILTSAFAPYGLHRPREERFFKGQAIFLLRKTMYPAFTYVEFPCYVTRAFLILKPENINLKYLTALLNSKLIYFWLKNKGKKQGEQLQIDKEPLMEIPLLKSDEKEQEKIALLVEKMLILNQKLRKASSESERTALQRQIDAVDKQIDELTYKLYNLTPDEIKIIEEDTEK